MSDCRVSALWIYPVKSCRGVRLPAARAEALGFEDDRRWMVVDADGQFLSQRGVPAMARVRVELADGHLRLDADGHGSVTVGRDAAGAARTVTVWGDEVDAVSAGGEAASWLAGLLGIRCQLVRLAPGARRPLDPRFGRPGEGVGFADGFPYLLLSEASLAELNGRLAPPVPMERFRPNIVVGGCAPHAEDGWSTLTIGEARFRVAKPCARCVIVTTDQSTGERSAEPLRALSRYRRQGSEVLFGQNLVAETEGVVRVGDEGRAEARP